MKPFIFTAILSASLLAGSVQGFAQTASTQGISTQISTLRTSVQSFADNTRNSLNALNQAIDGLKGQIAPYEYCSKQGSFYSQGHPDANARGCVQDLFGGDDCQARTVTMRAISSSSTTERCSSYSKQTTVGVSSIDFECPTTKHGNMAECTRTGAAVLWVFPHRQTQVYKGWAFCQDGTFMQAGLAEGEHRHNYTESTPNCR